MLASIAAVSVPESTQVAVLVALLPHEQDVEKRVHQIKAILSDCLVNHNRAMSDDPRRSRQLRLQIAQQHLEAAVKVVEAELPQSSISLDLSRAIEGLRKVAQNMTSDGDNVLKRDDTKTQANRIIELHKNIKQGLDNLLTYIAEQRKSIQPALYQQHYLLLQQFKAAQRQPIVAGILKQAADRM